MALFARPCNNRLKRTVLLPIMFYSSFQLIYFIEVVALQDSSFLKDFSPSELAFLATSIAVAITKGLDDDTISVLSSLFYSIGGSLILIVHQRELLKGLQE
jgi:hypothetical protein